MAKTGLAASNELKLMQNKQGRPWQGLGCPPPRSLVDTPQKCS